MITERDAVALYVRIEKALRFAMNYGGADGAHHKMWVIDQMVRALTGCSVVEDTAVDCNGKRYRYERQGESDEYRKWVVERKDGDEGPDTYSWDEGMYP